MFDFPPPPAAPTPGQVVTGPNGAAYTWGPDRWRGSVGALDLSQLVLQPDIADFVTQQQLTDAMAGPQIIYSDTQPPGPNVAGDLWYDTANSQLMVFDGSNWNPTVQPVEGFLPLSGGVLSGNLGIGTAAPAGSFNPTISATDYFVPNTGSVLFNLYRSNAAGDNAAMVTGAGAYLGLDITTTTFNIGLRPSVTAGAINNTTLAYLQFTATNQLITSGAIIAQNGFWIAADASFSLSGTNRQLVMANSYWWVWSSANGDMSWNTPTGIIWFMRNSDGVAFNNRSFVGGMGPYADFSSWRADKSAIDAIADPVERIMRLRPFAYHHDRHGTEQLGFMIDDLIEDCPEAVVNDPDGQPEAYSSQVILAALTAAVQRLVERIEVLEEAS